MPENDASAAAAEEHVRRLIERNRQQPSPAGPTTGQPLRTIGIVGAGLMGASIAAAHVKYGLDVVIADKSLAVLATVRGRIAAELAGDPSSSEAQSAAEQRVQPTAELSAVAQCDLVVESVAENLAAKQLVYAALEVGLTANALLTTNTSVIPIGRLAAKLARPERFAGFHFCHPVRHRPLVEVVRGPQSSEETIGCLAAHARAIGRMPIVVADGPGFVVNRLLLAYLSEALRLLVEGADMEEIERAMREFGMAMGPLELLDEIGLDTTLAAGLVMSDMFGERMTGSPLLVSLVKAGRLGRKTGAGFFDYQPGPQEAAPQAAAALRQVTPTVTRLIAQWAVPAGVHTPEATVQRLLLPMVLEATRILEEGKVDGPGDIDLAVLFGLGFPRSRGGLLWWADRLGAGRILEMLTALQRLGPRAQPTGLLRDLAAGGERFYGRRQLSRDGTS